MTSLPSFLRRCIDALQYRPTLRDLDDRTLQDIGIHRSEIASIEREAALGVTVKPTRLRIVAHRPAPGVA